MDIQIEFQLTADDLTEFTKCHLKVRRSLVSSRNYWAVRAAPVVFAIGGAVLAWLLMGWAFSATNGLRTTLLVALAFSPILALMVLGLVGRRLNRIVSRRRLARSPNMQQPQRVRFADGEVEFTSLKARSNCAWNYFILFAETPNLFLFYISPSQAQLIPKRAFASLTDMHEVLAVAHAHIGNQPIGFPVQPPAPPPA